MNELAKILARKARRHARVRAKISGTADRPRLLVHVSNRQVRAQLVDDVAHKTLATVSSQKLGTKGTMSDKAAAVGEAVAAAAKAAKIKTVVFDRGGKLYHGRVKALAEAARKGGLEF